MVEYGAVMLGTALLFVTIFRKLGLGATLGYIAGGIFIGPHVLGLVTEPERISAIAEIGIALLLFIVGLELHPGRLWRLRKDIFGLGLIQVVLCGLALSLFIYLALGVSGAAASRGAVSGRISTRSKIRPIRLDRLSSNAIPMPSTVSTTVATTA